MNLYDIIFKDESKIQEYGDSVEDVKSFLKRSYASKGEPVSIVLSR
jgi:hypothetical protein